MLTLNKDQRVVGYYPIGATMDNRRFSFEERLYNLGIANVHLESLGQTIVDKIDAQTDWYRQAGLKEAVMVWCAAGYPPYSNPIPFDAPVYARRSNPLIEKMLKRFNTTFSGVKERCGSDAWSYVGSLSKTRTMTDLRVNNKTRYYIRCMRCLEFCIGWSVAIDAMTSANADYYAELTNPRVSKFIPRVGVEGVTNDLSSPLLTLDHFVMGNFRGSWDSVKENAKTYIMLTAAPSGMDDKEEIEQWRLSEAHRHLALGRSVVLPGALLDRLSVQGA